MHKAGGVPDVLPAEVHQGEGSGPRGPLLQRRHPAHRLQVSEGRGEEIERKGA